MSEMIYDPDKHRYTHDGKVLPSVTQILDYVGLIDKTWFTDESRIRGTAVHEACALEAFKRLDWSSLHPVVEPYVVQYRRFLDQSGWVPVKAEQRVHTESYAGTYDQILERNGRLMMIDIKSGAMPAWACLQTAAYCHACDIKVNSRGCLVLTPERYKLTMHTDKNDSARWRTVLNFYFIKQMLKG